MSGTRLVRAELLTRPEYTCATDNVRPAGSVKLECNTVFSTRAATLLDNASDVRYRSIERNVALLIAIQTYMQFLDTTKASSQCVSSSVLDGFHVNIGVFHRVYSFSMHRTRTKTIR